MFSTRSLFLGVAVLALAACGGETDDAAPAEAPLSLEDIDLRIEVSNLPDPCQLLPPAVAAELLRVEQPQQANMVNEEAVARICEYSASVAGEERRLFLKLSVWPTALMSSAHHSKQQLVATASKLAGGIKPTEVREDIGIISFVFDKGQATRLQVLTGMGGADPDSGEPVSELQLGYSLSSPVMNPGERRQRLQQQALRNLQQLQPPAAQE